MISVLHTIAIFYILFTLLADYVQLHPLILSEPLPSDSYDNCYSKKSRKAWQSKGQVDLVPAQERYTGCSSLETCYPSTKVEEAPLPRPSIYSQSRKSNGDRCNESLEMPNLQEGMQCNAPVLRCMWGLVAPVLRPNISTTTKESQSATVGSYGAMRQTGQLTIGKNRNGHKLQQTAINGQHLHGEERPPDANPPGKPSRKSPSNRRDQKEKGKLEYQRQNVSAHHPFQQLQQSLHGCHP